MRAMRATANPSLVRLGLLIAATLLAGCSVLGPPPRTMTSVNVAGTQTSPQTLIVVLPGFLTDAEDMQERGVADAIHRAWPEPDVLLVDATYTYYRNGLLAERLHEQVIAPMRARGYRDIWLAGGSMGGMGTLIYEWNHPGAMKGLVLVSPFLGDSGALDEIRAAGGLAQWDAGPVSAPMNGDNFDRLVWAMMQGWIGKPEQWNRVWLLCGTDDSLYPDVQVMAPLVPPDHYMARPGGHTWDFWIPALEEMFRRIALTQKD